MQHIHVNIYVFFSCCLQLATKDVSAFPLPISTSSKPMSQGGSCVTTPSSSVEGIREELTSITSDRGVPESGLVKHQLRTSLTAETVETTVHEIQEQRSLLPKGADESDSPPKSVGIGSKEATEMDLHLGLHKDTDKCGTDCDENHSNRVDGGEVVCLSGAEGKVVSSPRSPSDPQKNGGELQENVPGESSHSASPSSSQPTTPQGRHRGQMPSPLTTPPTAQTLSRTSSNESPKSPFFIPSNPFLSVVGRMPRFQWAAVHIQLLEDLLKSLLKIVEKWSTEKRYISASRHCNA